MNEIPFAQVIGNPEGLRRLLQWLGHPLTYEQIEDMGWRELELLYHTILHEARHGGV